MIFATYGLGEVSAFRREVDALGSDGPPAHAVAAVTDLLDGWAIDGVGPMSDKIDGFLRFNKFDIDEILAWCRGRPATDEVALTFVDLLSA